MKAVHYLVYFFLCHLAHSFSFISGYQIDNSGQFGRDCDIISSSVTIINCPKSDTYEVLLTEMMANTTISAIQNEIKG